MRSAGGSAQFRSSLLQLLPTGEGTTGWSEDQSRFSQIQIEEEGLGQFSITGAIHVFEKEIQLPRLGRLRLKERGYLPTSGVHILSATVSEKARRWFVSIQVELEIADPEPIEKPIAGVDLGINRLAQVSDGKYFENPYALKGSLRKIKRLHRMVSRRVKGGANQRKAVRQLAKAYARTTHIRKDTLHQATTWLAKNKSVIVLEDLNVSGMLKNHHLAQAIAAVGMYEFRRQLAYKGTWYGCEVRLADRFYPSTKRCSRCGKVKDEISLDERTYECEVCGLVMDRDLNAALNLEQLITARSAGSYACGEEKFMPALERGQVLFDEAGTERQTI